MDHQKPPFFFVSDFILFLHLFFLVGQWMGAMCKFDFPIGRLRGVGEYVMYVVNVAQGTKGLHVKVYTTPAVGTPGTGHACSSLGNISRPPM